MIYSLKIEKMEYMVKRIEQTRMLPTDRVGKTSS